MALISKVGKKSLFIFHTGYLNFKTYFAVCFVISSSFVRVKYVLASDNHLSSTVLNTSYKAVTAAGRLAEFMAL